MNLWSGGRADAPLPDAADRLPLFLRLCVRHFGELVKLNLLFLLCCLPVVTIGPACAGLARVTTLMAREQPFFVLHDFKRAFCKNWKQALSAGLLFAVLGAGLWAGLSVYRAAARQIPAFWAAWLLMACAGAVLGLAAVSLFALLVSVDLPLRAVCKDALLLGLLNLRRTLPACALVLLAGAACIQLLPLSAPVLLLFFFSAAALACSCAAWPSIARHVVRPDIGT
ncbi:YesL family protein [Clostridiaceae bacterium NSJ-31]|uniref:YesL family protein n=1 Tax=Ligaoa zhengdingensis TaxID=2763658 RepID=A0A926I501_9FIRM|nr:YesL family protein [Ligaoa zhengdingensis]MBC8546935.1 YesL family protein [Ligaoa zhengdingensis]